MIVHVSAGRESESFAGYVDILLTTLGESNSSAARKSGVHVSNISNWRRGQSLPTIDRARQFADGLKIPRVVVMMKAGLLEPEDIQVDPLYLELASVDAQADAIDADQRRTLRAHVRLLINGTMANLEELRARRNKGRKAS